MGYIRLYLANVKMCQAKNTDYFNWTTLFCLLIVNGVKSVIDANVKGHTGVNNFVHYSDHNQQNHSEDDMAQQRDIEFQTHIVPHEYIIKFSGFYMIFLQVR